MRGWYFAVCLLVGCFVLFLLVGLLVCLCGFVDLIGGFMVGVGLLFDVLF